MHYTAHVDLAFHSVQHIMRDVSNGWLLRYLHANGASLFFIVVYMHLFRGLYYTSYAQPRELVWLLGVVILLVMILTAFIGYVLPWGQMSLWGATVITSLASALPIVGTSIVGWLWGGFSVLRIPLEFRQLSFSFFKENLENFALCGNNFFMNGYGPLEEYSILVGMIGFVKMPFIYSQSADVWVPFAQSSGILAQSLTGSGSLTHSKDSGSSTNSKETKNNKNKNKFYASPFNLNFGTLCESSTPAFQRLNAEEHAWLVGFVEADGWFGAFKNGKYIQYEFGLEVHKRDKPLLHRLKNTYKLSGNVRIRKNRPDLVVLKVRNKKDLATKIVPIFEKYPMLGEKARQFSFFKYHLVEKQAIYVNQLDSTFKPSKHVFFCKTEEKEGMNQKVEDFLKIPYFDSWLVGFINGEGCFSTYTVKEKYEILSFNIRQKVSGLLLLSAVKKRLKINTSVLVESTGCYHLKTASIGGASNVLNFLHKASVALKGHKHVQLVKWVKKMRKHASFQHLKIPNKISEK